MSSHFFTIVRTSIIIFIQLLFASVGKAAGPFVSPDGSVVSFISLESLEEAMLLQQQYQLKGSSVSIIDYHFNHFDARKLQSVFKPKDSGLIIAHICSGGQNGGLGTDAAKIAKLYPGYNVAGFQHEVNPAVGKIYTFAMTTDRGTKEVPEEAWKAWTFRSQDGVTVKSRPVPRPGRLLQNTRVFDHVDDAGNVWSRIPRGMVDRSPGFAGGSSALKMAGTTLHVGGYVAPVAFQGFNFGTIAYETGGKPMAWTGAGVATAVQAPLAILTAGTADPIGGMAEDHAIAFNAEYRKAHGYFFIDRPDGTTDRNTMYWKYRTKLTNKNIYFTYSLRGTHTYQSTPDTLIMQYLGPAIDTSLATVIHAKPFGKNSPFMTEDQLEAYRLGIPAWKLREQRSSPIPPPSWLPAFTSSQY